MNDMVFIFMIEEYRTYDFIRLHKLVQLLTVVFLTLLKSSLSYPPFKQKPLSLDNTPCRAEALKVSTSKTIRRAIMRRAKLNTIIC